MDVLLTETKNAVTSYAGIQCSVWFTLRYDAYDFENQWGTRKPLCMFGPIFCPLTAKYTWMGSRLSDQLLYEVLIPTTSSEQMHKLIKEIRHYDNYDRHHTKPITGSVCHLTSSIPSGPQLFLCTQPLFLPPLLLASTQHHYALPNISTCTIIAPILTTI